MTRAEELDRKWYVRYFITDKLTYTLKLAKRGNIFCAKENLIKLQGILSYMSAVGDISNDIYEKVYKLTFTIQKKYNIY